MELHNRQKGSLAAGSSASFPNAELLVPVTGVQEAYGKNAVGGWSVHAGLFTPYIKLTQQQKI